MRHLFKINFHCNILLGNDSISNILNQIESRELLWYRYPISKSKVTQLFWHSAQNSNKSVMFCAKFRNNSTTEYYFTDRREPRNWSIRWISDVILFGKRKVIAWVATTHNAYKSCSQFVTRSSYYLRGLTGIRQSRKYASTVSGNGTKLVQGELSGNNKMIDIYITLLKPVI